jgi:hypothetical protein
MHLEGTWFKDDEGRTVILRGVSLGRSSKVPFQPNGAPASAKDFTIIAMCLLWDALFL